ncbi:hypothetical protein [Enterococcus faecium]|uniref:hypothetical protein n=1 Tax=Enterococcus faecium TaxID=1352 RepID=UPI000E0376A9|nr:hypothetical protein [Enterococcus faecium]MCZ1525860.1 hypothetical protein [Enterococcus faecium]STE27212.1 Uncharacterised protein [Enterococcus faecium]HAQ5703518.1 hypothetical protein [Enterococcus faecium]
MKKTVSLLTIATILGVAASSLPTVASANTITVSTSQQQQKLASLPSFEISNVTYTNQTTLHIAFAQPINLSEYAVFFVYKDIDRPYSVPAQKVRDENNNLIGYDIDLDKVAVESTPNDIIANNLKFQFFGIHNSDGGEIPVTNRDLINAILNAGN